MYEGYWKLNRSAFQASNDAGDYYASRTHQAALLKLQYLVEQRQGAGVLAGAHGLGKTFLTHVLERELGPTCTPVARLVFPRMEPAELLAYMAAKLGAETPETGTLRTDVILRTLEHRLKVLAGAGRHPVLIVDEAHLLDPEHLQTLHLLLNLPQDAGAPFTLLLVGEPELLSKVQRVGALDDRITVRSTLRPLTEVETREYVTRRMERAGASPTVFSNQAFRSLWQTSQGVPRKINQLCDLSLLVGFADCLTSVSHVEIEAAAEELATVAVD